MNLVNSDNTTKIVSVVLAVVFGVLCVSLIADAVTTVSGTTITLENGETIANGTDGTITLTADVLKLVGTASTSAIVVGDEPAAPTINGLVHGYCSFADTSVTASTTGYVTCTSSVTGALVAGDKVFVSATGTLDSAYVIVAASTTGVSTIQLKVLNTGIGTADGTLGANSVFFWAVR